jgi:hypothetical protein
VKGDFELRWDEILARRQICAVNNCGHAAPIFTRDTALGTGTLDRARVASRVMIALFFGWLCARAPARAESENLFMILVPAAFTHARSGMARRLTG